MTLRLSRLYFQPLAREKREGKRSKYQYGRDRKQTRQTRRVAFTHVMKGRRAAVLAPELGVTLGALSQWKKRFDKGGRKALLVASAELGRPPQGSCTKHENFSSVANRSGRLTRSVESTASRSFWSAMRHRTRSTVSEVTNSPLNMNCYYPAAGLHRSQIDSP